MNQRINVLSQTSRRPAITKMAELKGAYVRGVDRIRRLLHSLDTLSLS